MPNAAWRHFPIEMTRGRNPLPVTVAKRSEFLTARRYQITAMAYELWCERGGSELENWLEAERRLQQQSYE